MAFGAGPSFQPAGRQTIQNSVIQQQPSGGGGGFLDGLIGAVSSIGAPLALLTGNAPLAAALGAGASAAQGVSNVFGGGSQTNQPQRTQVQPGQVADRDGAGLAVTETELAEPSGMESADAMMQADTLTNPDASAPSPLDPQAQQEYLQQLFLQNPLMFMIMMSQGQVLPNNVGFSQFANQQQEQ